MHRDGRYGPCRSLSPPIAKQDDYRGWEERCQVCLPDSIHFDLTYFATISSNKPVRALWTLSIQTLRSFVDKASPASMRARRSHEPRFAHSSLFFLTQLSLLLVRA